MVTENKNTTGGMGTNRPTKSSMMPVNEVFDIAGMVDYAEGSIVSRTLVESKGGRVDAFRFRRGTEYKRAYRTVRRADSDPRRSG